MVAVTGTVLGLVAVASLVGLGGILLHIIQPLSILFAGAFSFMLMQFLEESYEYGFGDLEDRLISLGLSVGAGFLVYKIIGYFVLSLGILTGLALGAAVFVLGPAAVLSYGLGFAELVLGGE